MSMLMRSVSSIIENLISNFRAGLLSLYEVVTIVAWLQVFRILSLYNGVYNMIEFQLIQDKSSRLLEVDC
jgi:hypothetical protein